jgi:hypothetical protein
VVGAPAYDPFRTFFRSATLLLNSRSLLTHTAAKTTNLDQFVPAALIYS